MLFMELFNSQIIFSPIFTFPITFNTHLDFAFLPSFLFGFSVSSWFAITIFNFHLLFCILVLTETSDVASSNYTNCKLCSLLATGPVGNTSIMFMTILIYDAGSSTTFVYTQCLSNACSTQILLFYLDESTLWG